MRGGMRQTFWIQQGEMYCESVPLSRIAEKVGTPAYVYSQAVLEENCHRIKGAFSRYPTTACFAVKSNSNLTLLKTIFAQGFGADVVSVGELERALLAGAKPEQIVFSGVGKKDEEIERALDVQILSFNVESSEELERIRSIAARKNKQAAVMFRINPNIDVKTHPHIATGLYENKFGIFEKEALELARTLKNDPFVKLRGLSCHIGSQILEATPFAEAAGQIVALTNEMMNQGHVLQMIDMGGGLGIRYDDETPVSAEDYASAIIAPVRKTGLKLLIEPGRSVVATSGVLLSKVIGNKTTPKKQFLVIDAAMNDLIRPSLYSAFHAIEPAKQSVPTDSLYDVVGPICETGDCLGSDRKLPPLKPGELVVIRESGAYGSSMASNYNTRPRAPEVLVDGAKFTVIRRRERLEELWKLELETVADER